ncbi:MAG TPA: SAM-dependent methyltransferase [Caldimonas sp.]
MSKLHRSDNSTFIDAPPDRADVRARFLALVQEALSGGAFARLVLAKPRAPGDLARVTVRELVLRGAPGLSFLYSHATRDITKNLSLAQGFATIGELIGGVFAHAHLFTTTEEVELRVGRQGRAGLSRRKVARAAEALDGPPPHDRAKHRFVDIGRPWLADLGVTDAQGRLVPAMARKWKQINKFIEVFDHAYASSALKRRESVRVVDFGSGKGYLTFAIYDHLRHALETDAQVTGVELRADLVELCNRAAERSALAGLRFVQGDVRTQAPEAIDVMIALHACDTATDHALHVGIRAGASIILCSPCCHKQLRPQLRAPQLLRPMLQHGIHLGQQAEMVTDSLRALLLEAEGYATQVFEFVALEHTSKNKMILAVKRDTALDTGTLGAIREQIRDIKAFYGIREHCLETLLAADAAVA